ncbi:cupin domain-containing protein [Sporosarcina sp. YIM B06819]|uniref:cupin domain-containing protein n=1 Tax=Sporosarcina sp. YIM B06819 TaxID=3081769 RepID=UPI00298D34CC|nr:cupin domain-containing protein [Sporosarcina sp. YIM B06819]
MHSKIDYSSPTTQFTFDLQDSPLFEKDNQNFINVLGINQLNTLQNVSLLDIFLSDGNIIEPHYHQHAAELVFCISGATTVSLLNPFTKKIQHYPITAGQAVNVPQGWWHYIVATADNTHFLGIFDAPTPEVILGSDILTLTPANIMAQTYGIDENQWKKAVAPVKPSTFIGPPVIKDDNKAREYIPYQDPPFIDQYADQMYPYTHQNRPNFHLGK